MQFRKAAGFVVAFWIIGALLPASASASNFRLRVEDLNTGEGVVITDQNGDEFTWGDESLGQDGAISLNLFGFGGTDLSLTIGYSKPVTAVGLADLYLNSVTLSTSGAARLLLTLEDKDFAADPSSLQLTSRVYNGAFNVYSGDPSLSTVTITSWANPSNYAPDLGADTHGVEQLSAIGTIIGVPTPTQTYTGETSVFGSDAVSDPFTVSRPYSLFTQVMIDLGGGADLSFVQEAIVEMVPAADHTTPEPTSLLMIGTGLFGLARARRRFALCRA